MHAVLQAITEAAVEATDAVYGWLLANEGDHLRVVAAAGRAPATLLGSTIPANEGSAGFVVSSGQPLAMAVREGDSADTGGVSALLGHHPAGVLAVPCNSDVSVNGALELVDKVGGGTFSFDDLEIVTLLGSIAAAALNEDPSGGPPPPAPAALARDLGQLAAADPRRYAAVADVIEALLEDRG